MSKFHQLNIINIIKEKLQKKDRKRCLKRKKTRQYGCEQYKNLPEDEKQELVQNRKKYKMRKNALL